MARTARRFASRRVSSHLPASEAWIQIGGVRNAGSFDMREKRTASAAGMPSCDAAAETLCKDHHVIKEICGRRCAARALK
jgi:hypothetical protein